jgi:hypothetical protein
MFERIFEIEGRKLFVYHPDVQIEDEWAAEAFARTWYKIKNIRITIDEAINLLDKHEVKAGK